jgi:hypothetical protein
MSKKILLLGDQPFWERVKGVLPFIKKKPENTDVIQLPSIKDPTKTEAVPTFYPSTGSNKKTGQIVRLTLKRAFPKVGVNEPCPCGSGLKYKRCCRVKHTF